jgi:rhodanese-related sulfurtransferase
MSSTTRNFLLSFSLLFGLGFTPAFALSPEELGLLIRQGEKITIVDVRPATLFSQGHIPDAINIPAVLVPQKDLPPLGRVVVYDDGLGKNTSREAVAALNAKPGIKAEILDGGIAAWEQSLAHTTAAAGLAHENLPVITYQDLKKTPAQDLLLVDLRKPAAIAVPAPPAGAAVAADPVPLTDLASEFSGAAVTRSPFVQPAVRQGAAAPPLLVLIDNGDGSAQETARVLKANGIKRFAILAGGEEMIVRKGQSGRQRASFTVDPKTPGKISSSSITNRIR